MATIKLINMEYIRRKMKDKIKGYNKSMGKLTSGIHLIVTIDKSPWKYDDPSIDSLLCNLQFKKYNMLIQLKYGIQLKKLKIILSHLY